MNLANLFHFSNKKKSSDVDDDEEVDNGDEIEDVDDAHDSPFETEAKIEPHKLVRVRSKRGRKPKVEQKKEPR